MLLVTSSRTSSIMAVGYCRVWSCFIYFDSKCTKYWLIYCDFSHFTSLILPCGRNNVKSVLCKIFCIRSNLFCMLLITSSRTSSVMAEKKSKWPIYCDLSQFTSIILPCGRDYVKSFFMYPAPICYNSSFNPFSARINFCHQNLTITLWSL